MRSRPWKVLGAVVTVSLGVFAAVIAAEPNQREVDLQDLASVDRHVRKEAVDRLAQGGGAVVEELLTMIDEPRPPVVRAGLVQAIRQAGIGGEHADTIATLLRSHTVEVRQAAMLTLQDDPQVAQSAIVARLSDKGEDVLVRRAAARALGAAGSSARSTLRRFATDLDAPAAVRRDAIRALAVCSPQGVLDVEAIATNTSRADVDRKIAITALNTSSGKAALTRLTASATAFVRAWAAAGLGKAGSAADTLTLVGLLGDAVADVRLEALRALVVLKLDTANVGAVIGCLGDGDVRVQKTACQSLEATKAGGLAAVQAPLRGLVGSATFRVRHAAALALHAYGDNHGGPQMGVDANAGSISQRKTALAAYKLITGSN